MERHWQGPQDDIGLREREALIGGVDARDDRLVGQRHTLRGSRGARGEPNEGDVRTQYCERLGGVPARP